MPTLAVSYSGFVNGDTSASLTSPPVLSTTATAHSPVSAGPYAIIASGASDSDYSISYVTGALTVTPAALTITANNQTKVYGAAMPTLTVSYTGLVNGDTAGTFSQAPNTAPTIVSTATASQPRHGQSVHDHRQRRGRHQLFDQLRVWHPHRHSGRLDHHRQQPEQGLWRGAADPDGQLLGLCQWRHLRQPDDPAHGDDHGHVPAAMSLETPTPSPPAARPTRSPAAAFLGTAANYNVYVSGNMSENGGSAATTIAVGGNASITQFSLAGGSGYSLVVGGNLNSTGTQILSGNAQAGGTVTMGSNDNAALTSSATLYYGSTSGNTFPQYPRFTITHLANGGISSGFFSGANATLTSDSSVLESQPQNGTVTFAYGTLTLSGSDAGTNYFNVSGTNLAATTSMSISVPSGATVIINVNGVTDQFSGASMSLSGTSADKILFNFYQATSVTLSGIELKGSLLAPTATLYASGGQSDGNVMVAGISVTNGFAYQNSAFFDGSLQFTADYTISYVAGSLTVTPAP